MADSHSLRWQRKNLRIAAGALALAATVCFAGSGYNYIQTTEQNLAGKRLELTQKFTRSCEGMVLGAYAMAGVAPEYSPEMQTTINSCIQDSIKNTLTRETGQRNKNALMLALAGIALGGLALSGMKHSRDRTRELASLKPL